MSFDSNLRKKFLSDFLHYAIAKQCECLQIRFVENKCGAFTGAGYSTLPRFQKGEEPFCGSRAEPLKKGA